MSLSIKQESSKLANKLLSEVDIDQTSAVPVEKLAKELGIEITRRRLVNDIEGGSNAKGGEWEIILDETANKYRERFTIAHEIGHLLADPSISNETKLEPVSGLSEGEMEDFCNKFASKLLVPENAIREFSNWETITITAVWERGKELEVALEPIMRRVLEEAPADGGFLLFDRIPGVNKERPFIFKRGVFPSTDTRSVGDVDGEFVIPYKSEYFTELVTAFNSDREFILGDMKLNLNMFPGKNPIRTAVLARSYHDQLLLVTAPPEIDESTIGQKSNCKFDESRLKDINSFR